MYEVENDATKKKMNEDARWGEWERREGATRHEEEAERKNEAEEEEDREKEAIEKRAEETHERWIIVKRGKLVVDYSDSNDRVWEFFFFFFFDAQNALIRPFLSYHCNTFNTNYVRNCRRTGNAENENVYERKMDRVTSTTELSDWRSVIALIFTTEKIYAADLY